jgi:hypothetical protein
MASGKVELNSYLNKLGYPAGLFKNDFLLPVNGPLNQAGKGY